MRDVKRAGDRDRPHLREVRQADGHQVGPQGEFLACSGYPECRNTMNFRREDGKIVAGEGGGRPDRREVPGVRRRDGDEARPLRPLPRVHPLPRLQGYEAALHRRLLPEGLRRLHHREALAPRQDVLRLLVVPELRLRVLGPPRNEACPQCGSAYLLDKYSKKTGPFIACPNKECGYRRDAEASGGDREQPRSASRRALPASPGLRGDGPEARASGSNHVGCRSLQGRWLAARRTPAALARCGSRNRCRGARRAGPRAAAGRCRSRSRGRRRTPRRRCARAPRRSAASPAAGSRRGARSVNSSCSVCAPSSNSGSRSARAERLELGAARGGTSRG